jgi:hypothetical protein
VLYVLALVAVVVGVDVLFFRNRFWERLIVNVGIVLVFAASALGLTATTINCGGCAYGCFRNLSPNRAIQSGTMVNATVMGWQDQWSGNIWTILLSNSRPARPGPATPVVRRSADGHHRAAACEVRDEGRPDHPG